MCLRCLPISFLYVSEGVYTFLECAQGTWEVTAQSRRSCGEATLTLEDAFWLDRETGFWRGWYRHRCWWYWRCGRQRPIHRCRCHCRWICCSKMEIKWISFHLLDISLSQLFLLIICQKTADFRLCATLMLLHVGLCDTTVTCWHLYHQSPKSFASCANLLRWHMLQWFLTQVEQLNGLFVCDTIRMELIDFPLAWIHISTYRKSQLVARRREAFAVWAEDRTWTLTAWSVAWCELWMTLFHVPIVASTVLLVLIELNWSIFFAFDHKTVLTLALHWRQRSDAHWALEQHCPPPRLHPVLA